MGFVRTLATRVTLEARKAFADLKRYGVEWTSTAKIVEVAADRVEKAAGRAMSALAGVQAGAANVRVGAGARASGTGSRAARTGRDPLDAAMRDARRAEREAQRRAAQDERVTNRRAQAGAQQAGLAAGAVPITQATAALGNFAKANERARAKVEDLSAQVERNRREMAELRKKALEAGDADGTLAARMRGLAAATGIASRDLAVARKELRGFEGGLIQAVKQATVAKVTVQALGTAIGNAITGMAKGAAGGIAGIVGESAKSAMNFEKSLVDIAKVAKGTDLTKEGLLSPKVISGIKEASKELGVMPEQVAELAAQITPVFSGKEDIVALTQDVTKIGVAWDVSGKEAGKFFADVSRGMQLSADETKKLFGGINELGNELGVKAADIAEAFTRSAGVIKASGLSPETGAALNATLIAAGASAEVAATGVRTFVTRLEAGEAASEDQITALKRLGLNAKDVAHNMAQGGKTAESQIQAVVKAIGGLDKENQISTLMQLFGSESLGSIGAAATAAENLGKAFGIASGEAAGFNSVLTEYDRVSNTTAARVDKLKANIGVLAIELGESLLPYIDKVVNFLTSPEGQEWGADAVQKAAGVVTGLADAVGTVVGFFSDLIDRFGATEVALGTLGLAIAALAGPWGIVATAALAAMNAMSQASESLGELDPKEIAELGMAGAMAANERRKQEARQEKIRQEEDAGMYGPVPGGGMSYGYAPRQGADTRAAVAGATHNPAADLARFNELVAARNRGTLKPSEAKELRGLSKSLDIGIPKKPGKGHKATKMDRQLAALDPSLAGVLTQGGEADRGGDLKVHDDILSRGAFRAATAKHGLGAMSSGSGGVGPGPNITTHNYFNNVTVQQAIDARGNAPAADNLRSAGEQVAQRVGGVVFTGATKVASLRNSGGRMA